jgi:hypothetical protein
MPALHTKWANAVNYTEVGPNCRLFFYLLGNWTVNEILKDQSYKMVLEDCKIHISSAPATLVSVKRREKLEKEIRRLQRHLDDEMTDGDTVTLRRLIEMVWETDPQHSHTISTAKSLKRLGFLVQFNHLTADHKRSAKDLFVGGTTGVPDFFPTVGNWQIKDLLLKARYAGASQSPVATANELKCISNAKQCGVFKVVHNKFAKDLEDPRSEELPEIMLENGLVATYEPLEAGNSKCCKGGTPPCGDAFFTFYCEGTEGGNAGDCNALSDPCP